MFEAFDFTAIDSPSPCIGDDGGSTPRVARDDLALMCEIGILALAMERGEEALPIFEFIDEAQPDNAAGAIGIAMIDAAAGRERYACSRLRAAISTRSVCVREAKAVLAILLIGCGRHSEARALRREILRGPDCGARRLIQTYGAA